MRALVAIGCLTCLACSGAPLPPHAPDVDTGIVQPRRDAGPIIVGPDAGQGTQLDGAQGGNDGGIVVERDAAPSEDAWAPSSNDGGSSFGDSGGVLLNDAGI